MHINGLIGLLAFLGISMLQAQTYHACQRSVGTNGSTSPLIYSSNPKDHDNIANMWWSTGELKIINDALSLVESNLNSSTLPVIMTQDQKLGNHQLTIPNVQLCQKKSFYYEKTEPLTETDFVLFYCKDRKQPILMPTPDKEYADRKCQWLYQHKATSHQEALARDVQAYADNVVEKITGQRPNRHPLKTLPLNNAPKAGSSKPDQPATIRSHSASPVPSSDSQRTSPSTGDTFAPISGELIL